MGEPLPRMTLHDFLDWEEEQEGRHEFHRGEIFAMVGARRVHNVVAGNIFALLRDRLRGSPCRAFFDSMKVQVAGDAILYPDVFVTCDASDLQTERVFASPSVVIEILSRSTQAYDRGLKFTLYRGLPSLREYLLVDPDTREVQLFRRGSEGLFTLHDLSGAARIVLTSIACELPADDVFEGLGAVPAAPAGPSPDG